MICGLCENAEAVNHCKATFNDGVAITTINLCAPCTISDDPKIEILNKLPTIAEIEETLHILESLGLVEFIPDNKN